VLLRLACVVVLCGSRAAAAERALVIELGANAPFVERELADALRVRIAATGEPVKLTVTATDRGVIVGARGGSRVVELGGRAGADAARLVALAAVDLLFDDLASAPSSAPGLTAVQPARDNPSWSIGVIGNAAQWTGTLAGATIDVTVPRGAWFAALDVGGGTLVGGGLHLSGGVVRTGIGTRVGWLDLRASATFVPIDVTDGAGDFTILAGAGASARLRIPLPERIELVIAGGADAFATRTEYSVGGAMIATPWVAPWFGAGIEVTP